MGPMTSTPGRFFTVCAAALLTSVGVGGCGLLDGSSRIQEALEYLPDDSTSVTFVDRAVIAERLDLEDLETGASDDDLDRWTEAWEEEPFGTWLTNWAAAMAGAEFSEFDVEWEATALSEDDLVRVWKLDDDADFDAIADDLEEAGYDRSGQADTETFSSSGEDAGPEGLNSPYPSILARLVLVPDERLIITGDVEKGLAVVTDDEDSLADSGRFDDLLDEAPTQDDLEYAGLSLTPTCAAEDAVGRPTGTAYFAAADEALTGVRVFADEESAKDDENSLVTYLDGAARANGLDVDFDVTTDGDTVRAEAGFADRLDVTRAWLQADGPFACAAE